MNNESNASIRIGGSVNKSKVTGGEIDTVQGTKHTKNDVSVTIHKDVTDSSEVRGGKIKVSESIDMVKLKAELKAEIQPLLDQLAPSPLATNQNVATGAITGEISANQTLKKRLLSALKAGGTEALKEIFNHPIVNISAETVKGFLEPG